MRTSEFLAELRGLGLKLWVDGAELAVSAPKGALTPELRARIAARKAELLALLKEQATPAARPEPPRIRRVPRPERGGGLPISFSQERLWFLDRLEPDATVYNMPLAWRVRGPLDVAALERALDGLVRRHEVLRTRFAHAEGRPMQVIDERLTLRLELVGEVAGRTADERLAALRSELALRARARFDLERGPLLRPALFRLGADEHVLFLLIHHIVFDGWSADVFLRELGALYAAAAEGRGAGLPELALQYADYAAWQRSDGDAGGEGAIGRQLEYWRGVLGGELPLLQLPTDRPRPAIQTYRGANERRALSPELVAALRRLAREEGVTFYMLLLAAFEVLLHRYGGQEDLLVGTVVAGRTAPEVEPLIGFFANTLVLRTDLSGDPPFRELLGRVRDVCLGAFEHQEVPFERLVVELSPDRDLSHTPLFQALFMLEDEAGIRARLGALDLELLELEAGVARTDLMLTGHDGPDGFAVWAEYSTDLFERDTIARLLGHYARLLEAVVADRGQRLSRLAMLTDGERAALLAGDGGEAQDFPRAPIHVQVERRADEQPDAVAVVFPGDARGGEVQLSYGELDARANRLAHHLAERGVAAGALVGLCLERSAELPVAVLAVLKLGAAYVPLDPAYPAARLEYMAADAGLRLVVTHGEHAARLGPDVRRVLLDEERALIAARPATRPGAAVGLGERMYVIYTSGSTGKPKGVEVEHGSVSRFLAAMARAPGFARGERLLAVTTLSFDIAVLELVLPLVSGGTVIVVPGAATADAPRLLELLGRWQPHAMQATPATWRLLLLAGWEGSRGLRILSGGEALPGDLARELLGRGAELWNLYGPTETTIWSTVERVRDESPAGDGDGAPSAATPITPITPITIGRPIPGTRVYVLDGAGQPVPLGVPGELWIAGDGVTRGYLGRPELTAERFRQDPWWSGARMYRTGDRGRRRADGRFECLGRLDGQVKLRGFRIELGEIEAVLAETPGVAQCAAVVREERPGDQRLIAYFVAAPGARVDAELLRRTARERLPAFMVPAELLELAAFPLTPNGKVDRRALPAAPSAARAPARARTAPRTELEERVAVVWQEVLGLTEVDVDTSFFELGGHSLLLAQVHVKLQRALDPSLSIVELFQFPTVSALASHVADKGDEAGASKLERSGKLAAGRQNLMQRRRIRR